MLRVTPWDICKAHLIPFERDIVHATKRVLQLSDDEIQPQHVRQMQLPERSSGLGVVHYGEMHASAAFVTAMALADSALRDGPHALRPFHTKQDPELRRLYKSVTQSLPEVAEPPPAKGTTPTPAQIITTQFPKLQRRVTQALAVHSHTQLHAEMAEVPATATIGARMVTARGQA